MSQQALLYSLLFTASLLVGCGDDPPKSPAVAQTEQVQECGVGDACVFRPKFGSALVFTNVRAYQRFRRSTLDTPDDSYEMWRDWEAKGDWTVLLKGTQIRILKTVEGGVEVI
jgi:hypothetical protein